MRIVAIITERSVITKILAQLGKVAAAAAPQGPGPGPSHAPPPHLKSGRRAFLGSYRLGEADDETARIDHGKFTQPVIPIAELHFEMDGLGLEFHGEGIDIGRDDP